jgi:DNA polymerase III epsilon subunit-like protein
MKSGLKWIILDTETDGFRDPIHVVEVAAQLMEGWEPSGVPFRVLINHGIDIDYQAKEVHGYDRYFLEQNGVAPLEAYAALRDYVKDRPIVTHNLSYDWDRALTCEWARLGIPHIGRRGFCSVMLAKRVIPEVDGHNLDKLKEYFGLSGGRSHQALGDVATLVRLMSNVIAPRLSRASLDSFEMIQRFSTKDIKACHRVISAVQAGQVQATAFPKHNQVAASSEVAQPNQADDSNAPKTTVYHVARPGKIIGQFHAEGLFRALREGSLNYDDLYWTAGMGQEWRRLTEIRVLIDQAAPKMASERQVVYLRWLGIPNTHLLTAKEAAHLIQTRGGNLGYAPDGKSWSTEKLIHHPDLFREDLAKHLSGKVSRECIDRYHDEYFDSSRVLDWDTAFAVIMSLQAEDRHWWNKNDFTDVFLRRLKGQFPDCCDGKSVHYYKKLPSVLSQYVRQKVVDSSERLTKDKVISVMESLSTGDPKWFEKPGFKERFFYALRQVFPQCCDGESAELKRDASKKRLEDEINQARRDIESLRPLATAGDALVQFKFGMAMYTLGKNSSRDYNVASENLKGAFEWLTKSAMAGNHDAQLALAFFASKKIIGFAPIAEVNAWLRLCYHSGRYKNQFEILNGQTRYVENPIAKKILAEIERLSWRYDAETALRSDDLFKELCAHFKIVLPG